MARNVRGLAIAVALAAACCAHSNALEWEGKKWRIDEAVNGVVERHRQMLVLADDRDLSADGRDALVIARTLYQQNRDDLDHLAQAVGSDGGAADRLVAQILKPELRDADRLAFADFATDLPSTPDVMDARERIDRIHQEYAQKLRELLERVGTRGLTAPPPPEPWGDYLAFLRGLYDRQSLLVRYAMYRVEGGSNVRGLPEQLPEKSVVLTFADGPHQRYTDAVLDVLDRYRIKAVFLPAGQKANRLPNPTTRIQSGGHTLVRDTSTPLGIRATTGTIDALDWKDPFPASIANRVLRGVSRDQRGIVVFHDNQRWAPAALPLVIDQLRASGYTFLVWNGTDFTVPAGN